MRRGGFSLVEVTIALGIVAFCVISVVALLPMGMGSIQAARERRNATEIVNLIAGDLLSKRSEEFATNYLPGVFSNIAWKVGETNVSGLVEVRADGRQAEPVPGEMNIKVFLSITPPKDRWSAGLARISLAWPGTAERTPADTWTNARDHMDTTIYFSP